MRNALAILLAIIWLLLGFFYYSSSSCYCDGNAKTSTDGSSAPAKPIEKDTSQSDPTLSIFHDPEDEKEITFTNSNHNPNFSSSWPTTKDSILRALTDENILRITGKYSTSETNSTDFENLGLARAKEIQSEFGLSDEQVQLRTKTIDDRYVQQDKFEAITLDFRQNTLSIDETSMENRILIRFPYNSDDRLNDPTIEEYLDKVASSLKNSKFTISIIGHTDNSGTKEYNDKLGLARANELKRYLVSKGANPDQILTSSKGETQPLESNDTDSGRALNRRAELTLNN